MNNIIIENNENLNLILSLPFSNDIIIGKLKLNLPKIDFSDRISTLYMKSINFKPQVIKGEYHVYGAEYYGNRVTVRHEERSGNCASCSQQIDISSLDIIKPENLLDGFTFILSEYKDDVVNIKKYIIKKYDNIFKIENIESISLMFKDKNLTIFKNNNKISLEDIKSFFNNIDYGTEFIFNKMMHLIFDSFVDEKGFLDIYKKYRDFITKSPEKQLSAYNIFKYYYYIGQLDFYFLAEYLIKNNMEEKIAEQNPMFTGKPIIQVKDIPVLSKIGMEICKKYNFARYNEDSILYEIEANNKIGTNGLKVIYEYIQAIDKIGHDYSSVFNTGNIVNLFQNIYTIINTFEITPKNLMDRITRAMFYENLSFPKYVEIIKDYIEMAKQLNVEIDKKLPKDVVRLHDLLKDQIRYIENEKIEKMFKNTVEFNNKLLKILPESDEFTIINPSNPNDLIQEGMLLNHCVGSYINRYATGYSKIFFIRKKENINQPFVTLELDRNNKFIQASTYSNRVPDKNVEKFINSWISNITGGF